MPLRGLEKLYARERKGAVPLTIVPLKKGIARDFKGNPGGAPE
jgi:hypothetical protein